jgi:Chaperone for flagella basal body P-ring formation
VPDFVKRFRRLFSRAIVSRFVAGAMLAAACPLCARTQCEKVTVLDHVEVAAINVWLNDLLAAGSCPEVERAAARHRLGAAPLPGSVRVLEGEEVRGLLQEILLRSERTIGKEVLLNVPERVSIRRTGARMSCSDLKGRLFDWWRAESRARLRESDMADENEFRALVQNVDCAWAQHLPESARLDVTKVEWNSRSRVLEFSLHCADSRDCVPFLIQSRGNDTGGSAFASIEDEGSTSWFPASLISYRRNMANATARSPLVKPGEALLLLWDQAGIRVSVPVICLERGGLGDLVRARVKDGTRVLRGEVVSAGTLRAGL